MTKPSLGRLSLVVIGIGSIGLFALVVFAVARDLSSPRYQLQAATQHQQELLRKAHTIADGLVYVRGRAGECHAFNEYTDGNGGTIPIFSEVVCSAKVVQAIEDGQVK